MDTAWLNIFSHMCLKYTYYVAMHDGITSYCMWDSVNTRLTPHKLRGLQY